jgi:chorismate synthase
VDVYGQPQELTVGGRHDATVLPRAVPIVEAMTYLVLADFYLLQRINRTA